MNTLINIPMLQGTGLVTPLKQLGPAPGQTGMAGFLNLILAHLKDGNNLQALQQGGANLGELTEKIAGILKLDPEATAQLELALQKIAQQIPENGVIKPTLIRDLAARIAPELQDIGVKSPKMEKIEALIKALIGDTPVTEDAIAPPPVEATELAETMPETDQLTELLNGIEPGAATLPTEDMPLPEQGILQQLMEKIRVFLENKPGTPESFAGLKKDLTAFLQQEGVPAEDIPKYLAALARMVQKAAPALAEIPVQIADTDTPKSYNIKTDLPHENLKAAAPKMQTPPPEMPAAPQMQQSAAKPAAQSANAPVSHLALINVMMGEQQGADTGGFGQQHQAAQQILGEQYTLNGEAKAQGASPQSFLNYMTAARGAQAPTTQMVALQIQRNIAAKIDTFTLQLEPMELGRLDVRMKFGKDGSVKAHLTVERPETLALLQRDQAQIERILHQSGLDVDENALSFDLRQQGRREHADEPGNGNGDNGAFAAELESGEHTKTLQAKIAVEAMGYITQNGVNIVV